MTRERIIPVMERLRKFIPVEVLPASSSLYFEKKGVITAEEKREVKVIRELKPKTSSYKKLEKMWREKENNVNSTEFNRESLAFLISKFEKMNSTSEKKFKLYDEQIVALLRNIRAYEDTSQKGLIEEMKMNEGKSAVVMPIWIAYLALRSPYIQVQTVNPYLVERDFEMFKKYAEVLKIDDRVEKIGYQKRDDKQYIAYPSNDPQNPKNKILFGLWSDFIHASQFAWIEKDIFYPTRPVIIMDEIDQIVQDESVTPAIITKEKTKTKDFFEEVIKQYNSFVDAQWEARQDLTGELEFDKHGIKIKHDDYMLENPSEFILSSVLFFRHDIPSLEKEIKEQNPNISKENLKQAILERLSEKIFQRVVMDKLDIDSTNPLIQIQKKCDEFYNKEGNLNSDLPLFWWDISDFQQSLVEAYFLRSGIDYTIDNLRNNVIISARGSQNYLTGEIKPLQISTGYSAIGKEFQGLMQIMISIKEGLKLPLEISSGSTDSIPVGEFYRVVPEKIFGFTGSVASIAERLREGYGFETTVIPFHKSSNREINWLYVGTPDSKFDKTIKLLTSGSQKNSIIVVESAEEIAKLIRKLPKNSFEIKTLTHKNEKEDKDLYSWISNHGDKRKVLITAKMVGRGIDLNLDEEVKRSGTLLISLTPFEFERSFSQVTGRIGRRGEKATVYVIISPDDSVFDTLTTNGKNIFLPNEHKKLKEAFQKGDIKIIKTLVERAWEKNEEEVTTMMRDQRIFYAPFIEIRGWLSNSRFKNPKLLEKIKLEWNEMIEISQTIFNNWIIGGWQSMDGVSGQITNENMGRLWSNIVERAIDSYAKLMNEHSDSTDLEKPLSDFIITQFDQYSTLPEKVTAIIEKTKKNFSSIKKQLLSKLLLF